MNHLPNYWGQPVATAENTYAASGPTQHTQHPAVTGTSVIGIKFEDGVVIAADNLASYGSLARFSGVHRLFTFPSDHPTTIVGCGGDVSDMQSIERQLLSLSIDENYTSSTSPSSGHSLNAENLHKYLSKVFYKRRSDFDPLWNHVLVGGFDGEGKPFLGSADLLGTTFTAPTLATGFGSQIAVPILRKIAKDDEAASKLSKEEAVHAIKECLKVLYYRDARSSREYSIAVVTKEGVELKNGEQLEQQSWAFAENIRGYGRTTE